MSNTYTQLHIQFVFAVKYRNCQIFSPLKEELYRYINAIIQHNGHKVLAINGMSDHIHIFIGMRPTQSISDLMKVVKWNSSKWMNTNQVFQTSFEWQEGYGAFSYSKSHVNRVIDYIKNQERHHSKKSFREEYIDFLQKFEIDFDQKYIFNDLI